MNTSAEYRRPVIEKMRRTTSDTIFDEILSQITSLQLMPGQKVSEGEVARQFDVSRQPVREAFIRLSHIGLLVIRPQRVTTVRKISRRDVCNARFVRLAIELETTRFACIHFKPEHTEAFAKNLAAQRDALQNNDITAFRAADADFHQLICQVAGRPDTFLDIAECKTNIDRLCALSLRDPAESLAAYSDHEQLVDALARHDEAAAMDLMRVHLSRLDGVITEVSAKYSEYFED